MGFLHSLENYQCGLCGHNFPSVRTCRNHVMRGLCIRTPLSHGRRRREASRRIPGGFPCKFPGCDRVLGSMRTRGLHARCHTLTKPISQKEKRQSRRANPPTSPHKLRQDLKEDAGLSLIGLREVCEGLQKDLKALQRTWERSMGKLRAIWDMTGQGEGCLDRCSFFFFFFSMRQVRWRREKDEFLSDEHR